MTEYYKFHKEIPRIFILPESITLNKFWDKKRRFDYYIIAKQIDIDNKKNPSKAPKGYFDFKLIKGIVGDKPPK